MKPLLWITVAAAIALTTACKHEDSTLTLVLVDGSCSRVNLAAYEDAWRRIAAQEEPGDRLVLGRILSNVREFLPELDAERPDVSVWLDNALDRDERDRAYRDKVEGALGRAIAQPCSQHTAILETLVIAGRFLAADKRTGHRLLILSDMLEDSEDGRFEQGLPAAKGERLIASRSKATALPDLNHVDVFVVGVAGPSSSVARDVERFWTAFFKASGGSLRTYGPVSFGF